MTTLTVICLVLLFTVSNLFAGNGVWSSGGPFGSEGVSSFTFHPSRPNIIFTNSRETGVIFRSVDFGRTWKRLNLAEFGATVRVHPKAPDKIFAFIESTLFSSSDNGDTWVQVSSRFRGKVFVFDLEFDPEEPSILYASVSPGPGIFKSTDGGKNWIQKSKGLPTGCVELIVDPTERRTLYTTCNFPRQVFKTTTGADVWTKSSKGLDDSVFSLAIDTKNPKVLYASASPVFESERIFKTTDGGASWFSPNPDIRGFAEILVDPKNSNHVYAIIHGDSGPLSKSTDGGVSWRSLQTPFNDGLRALGVHPTQNLILANALFTPVGIYRSTSGGVSWKISRKGLDGADSFVKVNPVKPSHVLSLVSGHRLFSSFNSGKTWKLVVPLATREIEAVDLNGTLIVASDSQQIIRSVDGGKKWSFDRSPFLIFDITPQAIAIAPRNQNIVYFAAGSAFSGEVQVAKSSNRGQSFSKVPGSGLSRAGVNALVVDPADASILYLATSAGIFKTTDGGKTFDRTFKRQDVHSIAIDPSRFSTLYANADDGIFKSTDAGKTWSLKTPGLGALTFSRGSIFVDPSDSANVFATVNFFDDSLAGEALLSVDAGETWAPFDANGLEAFAFNNIEISSANPGVIRIGTERGVFSYSRTTAPGGPLIDQVTPNAAKAGDIIRIAGRNFGSVQGGSKVTFGGTDAGIAASWSGDAIEIAVPQNSSIGPLRVTVSGNKSNSYEFVPVPSSGTMQPDSGPPQGGGQVAIVAAENLKGTSFNVLFGDALASGVRLLDPNIIVCTVPPGSGVVSVTIHTNALQFVIGDYRYK